MRRICLPLLGIAAVSCGLLPGQATDADPVFKMDVRRVVLYVTVREGKAQFIGDLGEQNFTVLEDGVPQQILSFSRDDVPVAIGLLVDNSQSMFNKREQVVAAAKAFVRASNPEDEMFILHFNEQLRFGLPDDTPYTGDRALLDQAIDSMRLNGRTALYDAIQQGLKRLQQSKLTKKALIVISDGGDNMSIAKEPEIVRDADLSGALFYGIGIYDPADGDANPGVLKNLAENTGGAAYFPGDVQEVKGLCETIARDLRSQYMLSYAPNRVSERAYHKVRVKINDPKRRKLIIRTRTGYYSPQSSGKDVQKQPGQKDIQ